MRSVFFRIDFGIESDKPLSELTADELRAALQERLAELETDAEWRDACDPYWSSGVVESLS